MIVESKGVQLELPEGSTHDQIVAAFKHYEANKKPEIGMGRGLANAATQGFSFGFGDELIGALGAIPAAIQQRDFDIPKHYKGIRDQVRSDANSFREGSPKTSFAAEMTGGLLTGGVGAAKALAGKAAPTLLEFGKAGAKMGGVAGYGYSDADTVSGDILNTGKGAIAGGLMGPAIPAVGRKLGRMANNPNAASPAKTSNEFGDLVNTLKKEGVTLTTGQQTGANWVKATERTMSEVPIGGKPLQNAFEGQQRQYQKALLRHAGLDDGSDLITMKTLDNAGEALGKSYRKALKGKTVSIGDDKFLNDLAKVEARNMDGLDFQEVKSVKQIITGVLDKAAEIEGKAGVGLTGKQYQRLRSHIGRLERSSRDGFKQNLYGDIKKSLDASFKRSAGKAKFDIDKQYAHYKQLRNIYERNGGSALSEGFMSPVAIAREAAKNPGSKQWKELTRAASAVLPDRLGNSGTAQRNMMLGMLSGAAIDPMSLLYMPLTSRLVGGQLAKGGLRGVNVPGLLPRIPQMNSPLLAAPAGTAGLLSQQ